MPRKRNLFRPSDDKPYKLSRSKIEDFLRCRRCFYLDRRLGVGQPSGPPFRLNTAVDELLKKEFDEYRERGETHPYMLSAGIDAVPAKHSQLKEWRENFKGVKALHEPSNLLITGAIDDLWLGADGQHIVVDYKATAKNGEVDIDAPWQIAYKRQLEIYQWLLRKNGLKVSDTGWFVYCNGRLDEERFGGRLTFKVKLIPYTGDAGWVGKAIYTAYETLMSDSPPPANSNCEFCAYRADARLAEGKN